MILTSRGAAVPLALHGLVLVALAAAPAARAAPPRSIAVLDSVVNDSIPLVGNVVYVDFWASWCVPCRDSFPWMQELRKRYGARGLQVVTVNVDRDPAAGRKFLAQMKSTLPVVFDPGGALAGRYGLEAMPSSFIYGRDGALKRQTAGFHRKECASIESAIDTLLGEKDDR
jgi:thiol-disulfide isomerase/thioredoxin